ncbi:hypothetical protein HH214_17800 [Mucilaginibacter robiniae]|uniref:DUF3352 domain-containing protein n=1 Tax=Mucilaginibacter robiniae TaxID=2728022 RepID=A0A7L5EB29_9SPHI|nr:hypothetical protein [Mucilaginibacter robiniae]QJD97596.1 hypothetical protein HH214_17800 [Mucilaginibacter robiniae]
MKRLIITTLILLIVTVMITVTYFKSLNVPGRLNHQVINTIPSTAALILKFNNDQGFHDIYDSSTIWQTVIGEQNIHELKALQQYVTHNSLLKSVLANQNIYLSLHPQQGDTTDFLITLPAGKQQSANGFKQFLHPGTTNKTSGLVVVNGTTKPTIYSLYLDSVKRNFYFVEKANAVISGSFSLSLVTESAQYSSKKATTIFTLLPEEQTSNSLANLYVNYQQLKPLLNQWYRNHDDPDLVKPLQLLPATAALSLNYKSDALMFNGFTTLKDQQAVSYLNLFQSLKPVVNELKNIFPATTAYSSSFAAEDVTHFEQLLSDWQNKAGLRNSKLALYKKIKSETGVSFEKEFNSLLGHEFAVVTTRFQERLAIIALKNGSNLRPVITNISSMADDGLTGQLNYDRLPFYLLGDAFAFLRRPYFMIVDNYLILANTPIELKNYNDNYLNGRFLSKIDEYNSFDDLLAERCNISFFIHFKNADYVLKNTLKKAFYKNYQQHNGGFKNFYAASYQLTSSDQQFYTAFCAKLNQAGTVQSTIK